MNSLTDQQLLRHYIARRSDAAFAELVRRHVDLVYSAALRMARDAHLAQDVTQGAFVALAQNAPQLTDRPVLTGWLHRTAQNLAANAVRSEVRRRAREQEAAAMNQLLANESDANWKIIAPHLDAALGELNEAERDAVLLRYFEKKSAEQMAQILGVSSEAAQKRVNRAVEKLREFLSKRKIMIGASGLAVLISANAVQAAPVGLTAAISAAAIWPGTAVKTSTVIAATKTIAMTTLQKTLVTATVAVLAGAGIYETRQASQLRDQIQMLQQQQAPMAEQIQQLQRERDDATNRVVGLQIENEQLRSNPNETELLKLRAEVTRLRTIAATAKTPSQQAKPDGYLTMDQLQFSGYSTPQAAFESMRWAAVTGNFNAYFDSLAPEDRQQITRSEFMVITNVQKTLSGLLVLAEKRLGGRTELKVMEDGDSGSLITIWPFIQIGGEWKMHGNEISYYKGWETNNLELNEAVPKAWGPSDRGKGN